MASIIHLVTGSAAAVFLADFISGFVHWAEDAYARKDTPVIGKWIGEANIEHHAKPRAFVTRGYWASSWDLITVSALVVATTWCLDMLTWQIVLFAAATANANQIHKWAHSAPHENPRIVTLLQKLRVIQTQKHHGKHHQGTKDSYYCSITNFLNPVLEKLRFWTTLEAIIATVTGMRRKPDPTVKEK